MSLVVVGLNHRTVPVELLERVAVPPDGLPKALHALARREHLVRRALHRLNPRSPCEDSAERKAEEDEQRADAPVRPSLHQRLAGSSLT